eukprot:5136427-Amphidinium_carterae.2
MQHVVLLLCKRSGTSTWTCRSLKQMLRDTRRLTPLGTAERRRARRVGSKGIRSTLPMVEEEEACDAILAKIWQRPDFELYADNGRTVYTRDL